MNRNYNAQGGEREIKEPVEIYECESCHELFSTWEVLWKDFGGEIGNVAFCPHCKEETDLILIAREG